MPISSSRRKTRTEPLPALDAPAVVLVGRPNVGKSTLFNRLCQNRRSITSPVPGTTRDWVEGITHWGGRTFRVIDTGGYAPDKDDVLAAVRGQVERWVRTARAVVWVVDGPEGLTPSDREFARWLRPLARHVVVAVNKSDNEKREEAVGDFFGLGFTAAVPVSAAHGRNMSRLLEALESFLPTESPDVEGDVQARVAVVGRPNVGKSSLLNNLLGEERMIVSNIPGTTRDTVDTLIEREGKKFLFMDTAGLRAKKSRMDDLEGLTRLMSEKALDRCEVAVLLLDGSEGLLEGDTAVARLIQEKNRACVVGINKWDMVDDKFRSSQWFRERQPADMPFLAYSPLVFLSAKTGHHVPELLEAVWKVRNQFYREFDNEELEAFFWSEIQNRPYSHRARKLAFFGAEQVATAPPTFVIKTNMLDKDIHFSYQRHLENDFRRRYQVDGTPLLFRFRRK